MTAGSPNRQGLIIAGLDPSAGAGLLMDVKVFAAAGIHACAVPSALVVENTDRVRRTTAVDTATIRDQIGIILGSINIQGVKLGMLYSAAVIRLVMRAIKKYSLKNVVLDPILLSSSGSHLLEPGAVQALRSLFPLCTVVTPNIQEASFLSGINITDKDGLFRAARYFLDCGAGAVVIKGGHFTEKGLDLYMDRKRHDFLRGRVVRRDVHGTGCILSSAITSFLIRGYGTLESVRRAKTFTEAAMRNSRRLSSSLKRYVGMLS